MKLTVFTPTYNRPSELVGLYNSLVSSCRDVSDDNKVEWLIVDDGSSISYSEVINSFSKQKFSIKYIKKDNGGKHTAFNRAIDECNGELFVCVDDDDRLLNNSIKDIFIYGKKYINHQYGAFVGRVVDRNNKMLGDTNSHFDELISNTVEIRDNSHHWGEPEIYFVDVLKQYRFDVFPNEKFLTEAYLFDDLSIKYPFVYLQTPLMEKKFLQGGLTDNQLKIRIESPVGTVSYYTKRYNYSHGINKIKASINKTRFSFWLPKKQRKRIFIDMVFYLVAFIMYQKDKKTYKSR